MMKETSVFEKDQYFYHPDHLGSSNYVTDADGRLYEHLEYFPFGETWVQEASNTQRTPYLFTSKELDEETGLYYYGARYYDPRTSGFISPDPLIPATPQALLEDPRHLSAYTNSFNNPLRYTDPDGRKPKKVQQVVFRAILIYDIKGGKIGTQAIREATKQLQARVDFVSKKTGGRYAIRAEYQKSMPARDAQKLTKRDFPIYMTTTLDPNYLADLVGKHIGPSFTKKERNLVIDTLTKSGIADPHGIGRSITIRGKTIAFADVSKYLKGGDYADEHKPEEIGHRIGELAAHEGPGHGILGSRHHNQKGYNIMNESFDPSPAVSNAQFHPNDQRSIVNKVKKLKP
jgi:RHS repeat-associated protein